MKYYHFLNPLGYLAMITINIMANALPINGQTTGEISNRFEVYFSPAGYAFSIWSLIYLGLLFFVIYQALPSQRDNRLVSQIGPYFFLSCLANSGWLLAWHYECFLLTLLMMLLLLLALIAIYLRNEINSTSATKAAQWFIRIPFSIYLSWITVATLANTTIVLKHFQWSGWGVSPEVWMLIALIMGLLITIATGYARGDLAYQAVVIWAYIAIAVKFPATPFITPAVYVTTSILIILLILSIFKSENSTAVNSF